MGDSLQQLILISVLARSSHAIGGLFGAQAVDAFAAGQRNVLVEYSAIVVGAADRFRTGRSVRSKESTAITLSRPNRAKWA